MSRDVNAARNMRAIVRGYLTDGERPAYLDKPQRRVQFEHDFKEKARVKERDAEREEGAACHPPA
jgi:hypothetical protein